MEVIDLTLVEDHVEEPAPAPRRRWARSPLLAFGLIVGLAGTLSGVIPFRDIIARNRQVEHNQTQLDAIRSENELISQQIAALESTAGVERLAREQFGLVYEGEVSYIVEVTPVDSVVADAPLGMPDRRPWFQRMWDYLTGRDLVPDEQP